MTMGGTTGRRLVLGMPAWLGLLACNQAQVSETRRYSGPPLRWPDQIIILDPGIQPSDVRLDQGVRARFLQATSDEPARAQRLEAGRRAAANVAEETVAKLRGFGLPASRQRQPPPPSSAPVVLVEGHMLAVDEGNSTRRRIVGLGAGASGVAVEIQVYYREGQAAPRLIDSFVVTARSPRTPGAVGTMGAGAAVSRVADAAAASAILSGVSEARSADTGVEGRRIGDAIAQKLGTLFAELGWIPRSAVQ